MASRVRRKGRKRRKTILLCYCMKCGFPHCLSIIGTSLRTESACGSNAANRHLRFLPLTTTLRHVKHNVYICYMAAYRSRCVWVDVAMAILPNADRWEIEWGKVFANKMRNNNNNKMIVDFGFSGWLVLDHIEGKRDERNTSIWWSRINMSQKFNELTWQFSIYFFQLVWKSVLKRALISQVIFGADVHQLRNIRSKKATACSTCRAPLQHFSHQTWRSVLLCVSRISFRGAEIRFCGARSIGFSWMKLTSIRKADDFFYCYYWWSSLVRHLALLFCLNRRNHT